MSLLISHLSSSENTAQRKGKMTAKHFRLVSLTPSHTGNSCFLSGYLINGSLAVELLDFLIGINVLVFLFF